MFLSRFPWFPSPRPAFPYNSQQTQMSDFLSWNNYTCTLSVPTVPSLSPWLSPSPMSAQASRFKVHFSCSQLKISIVFLFSRPHYDMEVTTESQRYKEPQNPSMLPPNMNKNPLNRNGTVSHPGLVWGPSARQNPLSPRLRKVWNNKIPEGNMELIRE